MTSALNILIRSSDPDAARYCSEWGAVDRLAIIHWVKGVKNLGLWMQMVCWMLRSGQGPGMGTVAPSLGGLGTYNGTLVNGPTWAADWMSFVPAGSYFTQASLPTGFNNLSVVVSANILSSAITYGVIGFGLVAASNTNFTDVSSNSGNNHHLTFGNGSTYISNTPRFGTGPRFFGVTTAGSGGNIIAYQDGSVLSTTAQGTANPTLANLQAGKRFYDLAHTANLSESFIGVFQGVLTEPQYLAVRALYKSTLGPDLGLQ